MCLPISQVGRLRQGEGKEAAPNTMEPLREGQRRGLVWPGKGEKKGDAEKSTDVAKEATQATEELPDTPVIKAAYAGMETDAMKRARELLARKRQQIIGGGESTVEG